MKLAKLYKQLLKEAEEGSKAAGAIIIAKDTGRILLEYRSPLVDFPLCWSTFGGGKQNNESIEDCCKREIKEELGYSGPIKLDKCYVNKSDNFEYHTFIAEVPKEFTPKITMETTTAYWFDKGIWPMIKHPGFEECLNDEDVKKKLKRFINEID